MALMPFRNTIDRYGALAQLFHWVIVALIITQFALGLTADDMPNGLAKFALLARHKAIGATILILAVLRLLWRWTNPKVALPSTMPNWEQRGAHVSHFLLYFLIFAMPL